MYPWECSEGKANNIEILGISLGCSVGIVERMTLKEPISDSGVRQTVTTRFKAPTSRRVQVLSKALFDGVMAGAVETALVEFGVSHGFVHQGSSKQPRFPSANELCTSQGTGALVDEFIRLCDALSGRLESLAARGRIAVVDPELVLEFVRRTAVFPNPTAATASSDFSLEDQETFSFTLDPRHIALLDTIGVDLFGGGRKRRAVIEHAVLWYTEALGISDQTHAARFTAYPEVSLLSLNRFLTRYLSALLAALELLSDGVGKHRLWSALESPFNVATVRLGNALFRAVRRT